MTGVVLATGDLAMDRPDPDTIYDTTRDVLSAADITFGQLEINYASQGTRFPQARHALLGKPDDIKAIGRAGFDVISFASNHCMDYGNEALLETVENLEVQDIAVVGAGENIDRARKAAHFTLEDGSKVAFLAYCSILPQDYWATERRPGCAPMRAFTVYEQVEHDQPGTPARIHTYAHREDLAAMEADIRAAKEEADVVFVSHHWGIHFVQAQLADYQREVARAAIAAGADCILGHHAHILKGAEVIDGKPVFYSLCNFAVDLRMPPDLVKSKGFQEIFVLNPKWHPSADKTYNFPDDSRHSMIARFEIENGELTRAGFLPIFIGGDSVPHILPKEDPRHGEVVDYMELITGEAGLNAKYRKAADGMVEVYAEG